MYTENRIPAFRSYKTRSCENLLNDPLRRFLNDPVPFKPDILQGIFNRYTRADACCIEMQNVRVNPKKKQDSRDK